MPIEDLYPDPDKVKNGVKLPLIRFGGKADDYIMVRWAHTDEVRKATDEIKREMRQKHAEEDDFDTEAMTLEGIISEVAGWGGPTFEGTKATKANIRKFLKMRPDIADAIDELSAKTDRFFPDSGKSS